MNFGIKNRRKSEDKGSVLSYDFRVVEKRHELWNEEREKKGKVYEAISDYVKFLEGILVDEVDLYHKYLIEKKLKQLRKLLDQYYVPSVLEMANYKLVCRENENNGALEGASFSLVKRRKREEKNKKK